MKPSPTLAALYARHLKHEAAQNWTPSASVRREREQTLRRLEKRGVVTVADLVAELPCLPRGLQKSAIGIAGLLKIGRAIPVLLEGKDVLGMAGTGTGKTAAFALPMIELLSRKGAKSLAPRGLVLVPTRELAMQVAEALHKYARGTTLAVAPLYGGAPMDVQIRALRRGVSLVVATPGRALDHLRRGTLDLSALRIAVLDEWGKRFQVTANVRIETIQDSDGFIEESRHFEELRAPDGEMLTFDGRRRFIGRGTGKQFIRAE